MSVLKYAKPEPLVLVTHQEFNERWVQEHIAKVLSASMQVSEP